MPLDWCGAQTQGTIGVLVLDALEASLSRRGVGRRVAAVVTRTLVDPRDPNFATPTKPIGRFLPRERAQVLMDHGQTWQDRGERGWRRVVASPEPLEVLDVPAVRALIDAGFVVVAAGGGGVPTVPRRRTAACTGSRRSSTRTSPRRSWPARWRSTRLVIATDVDHAVARVGHPAGDGLWDA